MYFKLLKKDLKRKKTMNTIMLIFIILASMFMASSANNMITVATALDDYFAMAEVPDYWYATAYQEEAERFAVFARDNGYELKTLTLAQIDPKTITIGKEQFNYVSSVFLSVVEGTKAFDANENEITYVNDGEIYVPYNIFSSDKNDFYNGCKIVIDTGSIKKEFTLKSYTKDALFGSSMGGMTRFLVSENDYKLFTSPDATIFYSLGVHTDDTAFTEKLNAFDLKSIMNFDRSTVKTMYFLDTLIAAVILIVSICLILISMVILRFTINFTMNAEFREIGVMKAIGISNSKIRTLYIIKYFAISTVGTAIGLALSVPFGNLLIKSVSANIIIGDGNKFYLNIIFAMATAAVVVLFCYLCTGKIKQFSPIDAIRSGETGERYTKKSVIRLSKSRICPIAFMSVNDILSGIKKYISMILIFTLGLLLIIIPVNTINTLQSDKLVTMFSMADCDLVITKELLFTSDGRNEDMINETLDDIRKTLRDNNIDADVFQEIVFRFSVSHSNKKASSLAFWGAGEVTTDMYTYIEGTAPQNKNEVALTHITAETIDTKIGDEVEISIGNETRIYTVTALYQGMNNLGEGIRFYHGDDIDKNLAIGSFGIQIRYKDNPDKKTFNERKELLKKAYPDNDVNTAGEYINNMMGDIAGQLQGLKKLILGIIICINILVAVLMVKSFITKEKSEIAVLMAIGFKNSSLVIWQSLRIGIVLLISIIIGTLVSTPLSRLTVEPIFRMMGAYSIEFDIVPLEVYVIYPLMVFFATVLASAVSALQLNKISASETSNIE